MHSDGAISFGWRPPRRADSQGAARGRPVAGHTRRGHQGALAEISSFLCTNATVAILINTHESGSSLRIRTRLRQMGFRIEAGVRCQQGLVLSAYRHGFGQMESAA